MPTWSPSPLRPEQGLESIGTSGVGGRETQCGEQCGAGNQALGFAKAASVPEGRAVGLRMIKMSITDLGGSDFLGIRYLLKTQLRQPGQSAFIMPKDELTL